eukprot:CAMPEP_0202917046 /NCGR_PEP_ID=MMETSP1392-20130828/70102_1 /ASSEMBLY_ACC=CAM_ASM_000868 /TAXON_ID=225041 /ORGANISM="Chlamydomonas chlamydogama, Strain SAG 11-48b" /LENGTH=71 /DNA_ID=CAMNT_0049609663 /DNA_START=73 /DNA_END=285 /DNA_ORIENTATION=+
MAVCYVAPPCPECRPLHHVQPQLLVLLIPQHLHCAPPASHQQAQPPAPTHRAHDSRALAQVVPPCSPPAPE